jgi:predicted nucleic acid-binding protein
VIAYLDTSVLLRPVLREPGALEELRSCEALVSSELLAVESLRTLDRTQQALAMATHDASLALAARSFGIQVIGS